MIVVIILCIATLMFFIHMMVLLVRQLQKDSNYCRYITVKEGRHIGHDQDIPVEQLLRDDKDSMDTVVARPEVRAHVTSDFVCIYIRLIEQSTQAVYEAYLTNQVTVGRVGGEANIQINDAKVSRLHCQFYRKGAEIYLQDMGSTNHTFLNECMLEYPMALGFGDTINIGNGCYRFEFYSA